MLRRALRSGLLGVILAWPFVGGCQPENFPALVGPTLREINEIRANTSIPAEERRAQLEALGLSPDTVNGLMRDQRTANQYGGNLESAYRKVADGEFTKLTPDEVQIYADQASVVDDALNVTWSDVQAADIQTFFNTNNLNTPDQLKTFLDTSGNAGLVPASVTAADLRAVFVTFDSSRLLAVIP